MPQTTCLVDGCPKPRRQRFWCKSHYEQWRAQEALRLGKACITVGCGRAANARGLCKTCTSRRQRAGEPLPAKLSERSLVDRFMSKVALQPEGCWVWTDSVRHSRGYGRFYTSTGVWSYAHRWSYEHFVGPIPDGLTIDHLCHGWDRLCVQEISCLHRRCVRPEHLEAVTAVENHRRANRWAAA